MEHAIAEGSTLSCSHTLHVQLPELDASDGRSMVHNVHIVKSMSLDALQIVHVQVVESTGTEVGAAAV